VESLRSRIVSGWSHSMLVPLHRNGIRYYPQVRKLCLFTLACAAVLSGCHSAQRSGKCVPIGAATRVVVRVSHQGDTPASDITITDPERIRQLTAFANARREGSQPSLYTMPAPQISAAFYDKDDFLGSIGAGANFFFASCPTWKGIRNATEAELTDFKRLIRNDK
jgi:hypothetical protein